MCHIWSFVTTKTGKLFICLTEDKTNCNQISTCNLFVVPKMHYYYKIIQAVILMTSS